MCVSAGSFFTPHLGRVGGAPDGHATADAGQDRGVCFECHVCALVSYSSVVIIAPPAARSAPSCVTSVPFLAWETGQLVVLENGNKRMGASPPKSFCFYEV
ncbi:hypothetical protein GOBAR_DD27129 [Gossypium barbadense]|nr:hypothetical protein GOBAR_DD27129 [Gossypium barbadense]